MELKWDRLIVALDLENKAQISKVVEALSPRKVKFKIGSIAFTKFGPEFVKKLINQGFDIFLDLKLYDIPNTMKKTAAVITEMGCWAFTVHLQAGEEALVQVRDEVEAAADKFNVRKPLILGVTVLTSSVLETGEREEAFERLVTLAEETELDGVISSPWEIEYLKKNHPGIKVITPGIRNPDDDVGDQVRITTAGEAFENGADYIVVGRPIIGKPDYLSAAEEILKG